MKTICAKQPKLYFAYFVQFTVRNNRKTLQVGLFLCGVFAATAVVASSNPIDDDEGDTMTTVFTMTIMIRKESHSMTGDRTWCPFDSLKLVCSFARVIYHKLSTNPIAQTQTTPRDSRAGLGPPSQWLLHLWYTSSWMLPQWDPVPKQKNKKFFASTLFHMLRHFSTRPSSWTNRHIA